MVTRDFGCESSLHAVDSSKSYFNDDLEDCYKVDEKEGGDKNEFVLESVSLDVTNLTTQVPLIDTRSPIQVPF